MQISPEAKSLLETIIKGDIPNRSVDILGRPDLHTIYDTADKRHRELLARGFIEIQKIQGPGEYHPIDTYVATPAGCEYLDNLQWCTRFKKHGGRLLELFLVGIVSAAAIKIMDRLFE